MTNKTPTEDTTATPATDKPTDKPANKPSPATKAPASKAEGARSSTASASKSKKPTAPEPTSGGGGSFFVWFVVVLIALGGAVTVGWPFLKPYVGNQVRTVVEEARTRLGLRPRPTQAQMPGENGGEPIPVADAAPVEPVVEPIIEPVVEPVAPSMSPLDQLNAKVNTLENQLGALTTSAMASGDGQTALAATRQLAQAISGFKLQLTALNDRLGGFEKALKESQSAKSNAAGKAQALVLAATQLRVRLMGDGAFSAELTALERIAGNDPDIMEAVNRLRPHAEVGVPSEAALMARFQAVAVDISRANANIGEGGWIDTVKNSLSGLVTVRRIDPSKVSNPVERAIAVSEASLKMGDLEGAVKALNALQGPESEAAAAWLGDARARVDSEAALESLYNQALAAMAQVSGS